MRLALLSDAHGNILALEAVLAALAPERVDKILYAGDFVGYYPFVNEVIDRLRAEKVVAIRGNHDLYLLDPGTVSAEKWHAYRLEDAAGSIRNDNRAWLLELPEQLEMTLDGLRIMLCHGSPWAFDEYIYPDLNRWPKFSDLDVDVVMMGHTHIPLERRIGGVLLVNPGSCGQPRDHQPGACYALLDTRSREVVFHRVPYDISSFAKTLKARKFPSALVDILTRGKKVSYDR